MSTDKKGKAQEMFDAMQAAEWSSTFSPSDGTNNS